MDYEIIKSEYVKHFFKATEYLFMLFTLCSAIVYGALLIKNNYYSLFVITFIVCPVILIYDMKYHPRKSPEITYEIKKAEKTTSFIVVFIFGMLLSAILVMFIHYYVSMYAYIIDTNAILTAQIALIVGLLWVSVIEKIKISVLFFIANGEAEFKFKNVYEFIDFLY